MILMICVEVKQPKLKEFMQVMDTMMQPSGSGGVSVYQRIDKENVFCLLKDWESRERLDEFLDSEKLKFIVGAANVLGETVRIIKADQVEELKI